MPVLESSSFLSGKRKDAFHFLAERRVLFL
jgi:hypothetical protein